MCCFCVSKCMEIILCAEIIFNFHKWDTFSVDNLFRLFKNNFNSFPNQ